MQHQHIDSTGNGKCDKCDAELCGHTKPEGAVNLICSRKKHDEGMHYDRRNKKHF